MTTEAERDVRIFQHLGCLGLLSLGHDSDRYDYDEESQSLAVPLECTRCHRKFVVCFFEQTEEAAFNRTAETVEQEMAEASSENKRYVAERLAFQAMVPILDDDDGGTT